MSGRVGLAVALTAAGVLLCCGVGGVSALGGWMAPAPDIPVPVACGQPLDSGQPVVATAAPAKVDGWAPDQITNATIIVQVGQQMSIPPRGWVIGVATAMQEANLHNPGNLGSRNDHDSLGVFQQRPSQGWGSPAQVMDPRYASRKFYEHLVAVSGWQSKSLTAAAQAVQRSAFPNAYAKHEPAASRLVDKISGGAAGVAAAPAPAASPGQCAQPGEVTAGGWVVPVRGQVISGFRTPSRPTHYGVDLPAPKRTVIHAASAGTVIRSICDQSTAAAGGCDRDGSSNTPGCGWYVDIAHAEGVITRYCHMIVKPLVNTGDRVAAGQQVGWSGTSGHSSGPHLHFEVHLHGDEHAATGAVDPVPFMRAHGAALGA